ncbi:hypothetical protein EVAR_22880_1 [Eumeta japonica]|uniref:Uncharacterized protein n=1 Tax=Eumeta variegata TaxID=151549 RepID=A0A4C1UUS2_EUMVA|nr:hypothetical protein EVAR_22880_1 [Eumeta japonica]
MPARLRCPRRQLHIESYLVEIFFGVRKLLRRHLFIHSSEKVKTAAARPKRALRNWATPAALCAPSPSPPPPHTLSPSHALTQ